MKRFLKILLCSIGGLLGLLLLIFIIAWISISVTSSKAVRYSEGLQSGEVKTLTVDGFAFRDLNKNGRLDVYEDPGQPVEERVNDLLSQMTIEEKAGTMFFSMISMKKDGSISEKPSFSDPFSFIVAGTSNMMFMKHINHFSNNPLASAFAGDFSQFPEPVGLAAIGDSLTVFEFGDIARQEYLAAGIRVALHPQIDLATEPRWGRINSTFGEDAALSSKLTYAYIKGFQGDSMGVNSVACMTKHFPGGGPQRGNRSPFPDPERPGLPGEQLQLSSASL